LGLRGGSPTHPRLLQRLEVQHDQSWHDIVVLYDSWCDLTTDHDSIRLPQRSQKQYNPRRSYSRSCGIQTHFMKFVEKRSKWNAEDDVTDLLSL
jgi:hypothetical protein